MINSETQYSIYKINNELVKEKFSITKSGNINEYSQKIISALTNNIKSILTKYKNNSKFFPIEYQDIKGIIFKTTHYPAWKYVACELLSNNEIKTDNIDIDWLSNTNISYVYFYPFEEEIFAVTGGYGSSYISKYIEKNFGLYILPKILNKEHTVIKSIYQNNMLGNQTASQRTNKNSTSIQTEKDMSSIFRQLSIEATRDIAEKLGLTFDENESVNKKINIVNKDSIVIHRSITIDELKEVIKKIYYLEKNTDNFALNYLVFARKKGFSNKVLNNKLIETLLEEKYDNFILSGGDYVNFLFGVDKYIVKDINQEIIIEQDEPITFSDLINKLNKINKTSFENLLKKHTISTIDNSGNTILNEIKIFDLIQGFIEFGENKQPFYLFSGEWYVFDEKFSNILDDEYKELYAAQKNIRDEIIIKYNLLKSCKNEDDYNNSIRLEGVHLVTHTALIENVEIADIIIFEKDEIFLMHNKQNFDGTGVRDVTNQIYTSANYLQQKLISPSRDTFLTKYYNIIKRKYIDKGIEIPLTQNDFFERFSTNKKLHYLIGFINGYNDTSNSTYAKYLSVEINKKLFNKGIKCTILQIGEK